MWSFVQERLCHRFGLPVPNYVCYQWQCPSPCYIRYFCRRTWWWRWWDDDVEAVQSMTSIDCTDDQRVSIQIEAVNKSTNGLEIDCYPVNRNKLCYFYQRTTHTNAKTNGTQHTVTSNCWSIVRHAQRKLNDVVTDWICIIHGNSGVRINFLLAYLLTKCHIRLQFTISNYANFKSNANKNVTARCTLIHSSSSRSTRQLR